MSRRIDVPASVDLNIGQRARLRTETDDIALFNIAGQIYAIADSCPHAGGSLLYGTLDGCTIQCPAHGLHFDLVTGCMRGGSMRARTYPVVCVDGQISVTISDDNTTET